VGFLRSASFTGRCPPSCDSGFKSIYPGDGAQAPFDGELRKKEPPRSSRPDTCDGKAEVRFFVSYAHDDKELKERLLTYLKPMLELAPGYDLVLCDDTEILIGENWHEEIRKAVDSCQFGLFLVTAAFLNSKHIIRHEFEAFVGSNVSGRDSGKRVIPVALKW